MFEPRYHGEVRDPDTTPSQDLATEFNLHLAGSIVQQREPRSHVVFVRTVRLRKTKITNILYVLCHKSTIKTSKIDIKRAIYTQKAWFLAPNCQIHDQALAKKCNIAYIANMAKIIPTPNEIRALRNHFALTQEQFAERLGVAFTTVNRWEGGDSKPQRAAIELLAQMMQEAGMAEATTEAPAAEPKAGRSKRKTSAEGTAAPTTKPMEQMLWDPACSIRGEKDAAKFKDYLLPLLFLKRLSDVFDDEIGRLADEYGDRATSLEIAESDHSLLRFYLPPEARWKVISGRYEKDEAPFEWPLDEKGRSTAPKDIGEHLVAPELFLTY
jgi:DNA-binding transcriptional regulator YiaG